MENKAFSWILAIETEAGMKLDVWRSSDTLLHRLSPAGVVTGAAFIQVTSYAPGKSSSVTFSARCSCKLPIALWHEHRFRVKSQGNESIRCVSRRLLLASSEPHVQLLTRAGERSRTPQRDTRPKKNRRPAVTTLTFCFSFIPLGGKKA